MDPHRSEGRRTRGGCYPSLYSHSITHLSTFQIKTPPELENFEYASSDEDIWDALSNGKDKKKANPPPTRRAKVNTTCEWQRCNAQFSNNIEYRSHITKHFQELVLTQFEDEYLCEWDLCGFKTNCVEMFERHVLHHEMHGRYLSAGESLEITNKVPKCILGGLDRNRLPELPTDFSCLWGDCTEIFRALSVLHDHVRDHVKDSGLWKSGKKSVCQWRGCSLVADSVDRINRHITGMHINVNYFACRKCGLTRKSVKTFLGHFLSQAPVKSEFWTIFAPKYFINIYLILFRPRSLLSALQPIVPERDSPHGTRKEPAPGSSLQHLSHELYGTDTVKDPRGQCPCEAASLPVSAMPKSLSVQEQSPSTHAHARQEGRWLPMLQL